MKTKEEQAKRTALKLLVPPHSATLAYEDRDEFYNLFDTNIEKYQPMDDHETAIVREITDLQWSSLRARLAIHTLLNTEILRTGSTLEPVIEENRAIENIIAAYDSLNKSTTLKNFHKEYAANTRLIATLERRLKSVQRNWPSQKKTLGSTAEERKAYGASEGTQQETNQPVENKETAPKKRVKTINVQAPLTPEKIRLYKQIFPNRELKFNVNPKAA